jgi:hypothetical protein
MLKRKFVDDALVQGDYMSGDRNTIASALRINNRMGVVILTAKGHDATGKDLYNFYKAAATANRVELITANLPPSASKDAAYDVVQKRYKEIDNWYHNEKDKGKNPAPLWLRERLEKGVRIHSVSFGTGEIGRAYKQDLTGARALVKNYWRLPTNSKGVSLRAAVGNYLIEKGFQPSRAYVFLFAKRGDPHAEKAHHFTSILTWRILQERIDRETTVIPVATGEDIGLSTRPRMVKFWEDPSWTKIFEGHNLDARSAQLGMWCYLAENFKGLSIIGMRSGMIEVPALLGIRTLYLEEAHNQQAARMEKWLGGVVDGFERQVVDRPPGINQQIYWADQASRAPRNSAVNQHAWNNSAHLGGMVMGFQSKSGATEYKGKTYDAINPQTGKPNPQSGRSLAAKQPGTLVKGSFENKVYSRRGNLKRTDVISAVFGSGGLGKIINANQFTLLTSEFESIIEWVNRTPKPTGAKSNLHGYIDGHLVKRDDYVNKTVAKREDQTYSQYFASPEYRKGIGADDPLVLKEA